MRMTHGYACCNRVRSLSNAQRSHLHTRKATHARPHTVRLGQPTHPPAELGYHHIKKHAKEYVANEARFTIKSSRPRASPTSRPRPTTHALRSEDLEVEALIDEVIAPVLEIADLLRVARDQRVEVRLSFESRHRQTAPANADRQHTNARRHTQKHASEQRIATPTPHNAQSN